MTPSIFFQNKILKLSLIFSLLFHLSLESNCLGSYNNTCVLCNYDSYILDKTPSPYNQSLCIPKIISNANSFRLVLVTNKPISNLTLFNAIYFDFYECLFQEAYFSSKLYSSNLTIYLTKGSHMFYSQNQNDDFFRRTLVDIKIKPLYCNEFNLSEICETIGDSTQLVLKSFCNFFISKNFYLTGITIDGSDLPLASLKKNTINEETLNFCRSNISTCCSSKYYDNIANENTNDIKFLCGLNQRKIQNADSNILSFLTLEIIYDVDMENVALPFVFFQNVVIRNLILIDYSYQRLIYAPKLGKIILENIKILNFFAVQGFFYFGKENLINLYKNTIGEINLSDETLLENLANQSILNITNAFFLYTNEMKFIIEDINIQEIKLFPLVLWKSSIYLFNFTISNLTNNIRNIKLILFFIQESFLKVDTFHLMDSENLQILSISKSIVQISNAVFTNIALNNYYGLFIETSNVIFANITFDTFKNPFRQVLLYIEDSNTTFSGISLISFLDISAKFIASETKIINFFCENSNFIDQGFFFQSQDVIFSKLYMKNVKADSQFFTISNSNKTTIEKGYFQSIDAPIYLKPLSSNCFILIDCYFSSNTTINSFIAQNTILKQIQILKNIFWDATITTFTFGMNDLWFIELNRNYFKNMFHDINKILFVFQNFQGYFFIYNNIFENITFSKSVISYFSIETCYSDVINSSFIMPSLTVGAKSRLLFFWKCLDIFIDSSNFLVESYGFMYSLVHNEDATYSFTVINSNFITFQKKDQFVSNAIFSSGCPLVNMHSNFFANFQCNSNEIISIVGPISFQGVSSFSTVKNNFSLKLFLNKFVNCSCMYGGSLGILNYNRIDITELSSNNSNSIFGGTLFLRNCYEVLLSNSSLSFSKSYRGSIIYVWNSNHFKISNNVFLESVGYISGAIEAKFVHELDINFCNFSQLFSQKIGSFICLSASQLFLYNNFLEISQSLSYGGAIYLSGLSNLSISFLFSNNTSSYMDGGFLYVESSNKISINSSVITNSNSNLKGAAFCINNVIDFQLFNVKFINCEAQTNGVIFISSLQNSKIIKLIEILCYQNTAIIGSCIFYSTPSNLKIENLSAFENKGIILDFDYVFTVGITIHTGKILNNINNQYIFSIRNVNITLENFYFNNNSICSDLIYLENAELFLKNISFNHPLNFLCPLSKSYSRISIVRAISSKIRLYEIFFQGFDTYINSELLILFFSLKNSEMFFYNSLIQNNWYQENGLILLDNCICVIELISFINNKGPILNIINSIMIVRKCHFQRNFASDQNVNDIFIKNEEKTYEIDYSFSCFNSIFENSQGLSFSTQFTNEILFSNCYFIGLSLNMSQAVYITNCLKLTIDSSLFFHLEAHQGSSLKIFLEKGIFSMNSQIIILNSSFLDCKNSIGGTVFIKGGNQIITIQKNLFQNNQAFFQNNSIGIVGALTLLNLWGLSNFSLKMNSFINNTAKILPTVYSNSPIIEFDNIYLNNSDEINMTTFASFTPYQIKILQILNNTLILDNSTYNIRSGNSFSIIISLNDALDKILIYDKDSSAIIRIPKNQLENSNISKIQNNLAISNKGIFYFDKLLVFASPNTTFQLEIQILFTDLFEMPFILTKTLSFHSQPCSFGEILTLNQLCLPCYYNSFSLADQNQNSSNYLTCQNCLQNAFCPGYSLIIPNKGYWRMSSSSLIILPCLVSEYCIGSQLSEKEIIYNLTYYQYKEDFLKGICQEGHEKNLCHECKYGYGKFSTNGSCQKCKDYSISAIIRLTVISLLVAIYLVFNSLEILSTKNNNSLINEVSKVSINHLQKMSVISFMDLNNLIESAKNFFGFLSLFNLITEDIFSNDCFIQMAFSAQEYNFHIIKVFVTMILPLVLTILAMILLVPLSLAQIYMRKNKQKQSYLNKIFLIAFIAVFLVYPLITKISLSLLNCISLDSSKMQYMYNSPNLVCWDQTHYFYFLIFGLIGIILFGIGYPFFLFFLIRKKKMKDKLIPINPTKGQIQPNIMVSEQLIIERSYSNYKKRKSSLANIKAENQENFLSFFYKEYKSNCYFWETIIFLQKFLLTLLPNLNQLIEKEYSNLLFFSISLVYLFAVLKYFPFQRGYINLLEINSIITNILTKMCLLIVQSRNLNERLKYSFMIIQMIFNIFFFLHLIYIIIRYTDWRNLLKKSLESFSRIEKRIKTMRKSIIYQTSKIRRSRK